MEEGPFEAVGVEFVEEVDVEGYDASVGVVGIVDLGSGRFVGRCCC